MIRTLALCIALSLGNMVRGGWWFGKVWPEGAEPWWKKSDPLFSLLHVVSLAPFIWASSFFVALGNQIGAASGLGVYVGSWLNGEFEGGAPKREVPWIDFCIKPYSGNVLLYAWIGMLLRGIQWSACIAIMLAIPYIIANTFGNPYGIQFEPRWFIGALGYALMPIGFTIAKISSIIPPSKQWLAGECINGSLQGLLWGIALT